MISPTGNDSSRSGSRPLQLVQARRKTALMFVAVLGTVALAFVEPQFRDGLAGAVIFSAALAFIGAGVLLRTWAAIYVAGRKTRELVTSGPYARMRNPLYGGTLSATFGAVLSFGSVTMALALTLATFLLLEWVAGLEEKRMAEEFGAAFASYGLRVRRWLPTGAPEDRERIEVQVSNVVRTLAESLLFLAGPALARMLNEAQQNGWIEPVLRLP
ncbi:MAG: isoprenylcysteine carboxylmethyltransferase family protein [Beijerinckiaceae bacterium]|nr:isoprenylcysteine carboxylmethyltransferase family protein [Beijerinckiaceae bacterium]